MSGSSVFFIVFAVCCAIALLATMFIDEDKHTTLLPFVKKLLVFLEVLSLALTTVQLYRDFSQTLSDKIVPSSNSNSNFEVVSDDLNTTANINGVEYDIAQTTELTLNNLNLSDLSEVGKLVNLRVLYLNENNIHDISPLANLTLMEHLEIKNNNISDISALANMRNLKELHAGYNKIESLAPIANLTEFEYLSLHDNKISYIDINFLKNSKNLKTLYLWSNQLSSEQKQAIIEARPNCRIEL